MTNNYFNNKVIDSCNFSMMLGCAVAAGFACSESNYTAMWASWCSAVLNAVNLIRSDSACLNRSSVCFNTLSLFVSSVVVAGAVSTLSNY